jgi:biotin carboxyl carrier protein
MPGIVREVFVRAGDAVEAGRPLLILEAMKMQNEIRAERAGVVSKVHVSPEDTVDKGAKLVEIE